MVMVRGGAAAHYCQDRTLCVCNLRHGAAWFDLQECCRSDAEGGGSFKPNLFL